MIKQTRRAFLGGLAISGALAGTAALSQKAKREAQRDLSFVHPELRPFASALMDQVGGMPDATRETLPALRKMMSGFVPPALAAPSVRRHIVQGRAGRPDVVVYIINAQAGKSKPAILHTHGGGYIMGDAVGSVGLLQPTAAELDCVIVSVEYRLAPETTFEGSIDDNYSALKWLYDSAAELGVDRNRIAVMGESAGGGHAALLAITARDRGEVPLVLQVLIYPMLDDRTGSVVTPPAPIGSILWTTEKNRFGWQSFLGQSPGTEYVPRQAVPARQASLEGLPPAFVGVGSIDLFVNEDIDYARRLINDGVEAELLVIPGAFHGFDDIAPATSVVQKFKAAKHEALRRAFTVAIAN
jgi:acetyl esterase/lipase